MTNNSTSAAPAPEGGAVFYKVKAAIERAMMDERDGKPCGCIIEAGCESRGYADPAYAASGFIWAATDAVMQALTTREESPAEAGELVWFDVRDVPQDGTSILLNHRTHGIIQGWLSKGEWSDDTPISPREYSGDMWILGDDLYQDEVEFGEGGVVLPSGVLGWLPLSALRAQPPSREDAQPDTDCVSLLADLDAGKPVGREAAATIRSLIAERPARDALRAAVEALGPFAHIASHVGLPRDGTVHLTALDGKWIATIDRADFWRAASVLAAQQAEQKGGA